MTQTVFALALFAFALIAALPEIAVAVAAERNGR